MDESGTCEQICVPYLEVPLAGVEHSRVAISDVDSMERIFVVELRAMMIDLPVLF